MGDAALVVDDHRGSRVEWRESSAAQFQGAHPLICRCWSMATVRRRGDVADVHEMVGARRIGELRRQFFAEQVVVADVGTSRCLPFEQRLPDRARLKSPSGMFISSVNT
jgi:hypothetical protein